MRKFMKYASIISAALVVAVGVFLLGGREGYQYAFYKIAQAIAKSNYPTVKVVSPTKQAIAIIRGGVCIPYPKKLPKFYHIEWVSPYDNPCGTGKYTGKPIQDSAALAAITKEVEGEH